MTTTDALTDTTRAMIEATQRRLDEAARTLSPRDLGITPDRSRNGQRPPRRAQRRRFIR